MQTFREELRYDYPLTPASVIIEAGTHEGRWLAGMIERHHCRAYSFEPIVEFFSMAAQRVGGRPGVTISNCGLASSNRTERWKVQGELTGQHSTGAKEEEVVLVDFVAWLHAMAGQLPAIIDLLEINIEGGEYELLETIIARGVVHRFKNIQVQFHGVGLTPVERRRGIQDSLAKTHHLTYNESFCWENWELNS